MTDRWMSVEEIADYLNVSKDTVYTRLAEGTIPAHKLGRLWRFKPSEVDEWVKSGIAASRSTATRLLNNQ